MKIDITKCVCARCFTAKVSEKDKSGIFLNYQGEEIPFCNTCAVELANLMLDAVKENGWKEIRDNGIRKKGLYRGTDRETF